MNDKRRLAETPRGFTLIEVMVGIGMAGALVLMVLLLGTTAVSTDSKASEQQIAAAVAEGQLELLSRQVSMDKSSAREKFWTTGDGPYSGPAAQTQVSSNGTDYQLEYQLKTPQGPTGGNIGSPGNRLRQVQLQVTWWQGEKGKPGYGQFSLQRTRVLRESNVRS